jgi:hypothetical protein
VNLFANDPALRGSGGGKCLIIPVHSPASLRLHYLALEAARADVRGGPGWAELCGAQAGATWDAVLASAGAKLGFADDGGLAKRLFTANGAEVEAVDEVMPNDVLYVSRGEDFGQPSTAATAVASPRPPPPSFPYVSETQIRAADGVRAPLTVRPCVAMTRAQVDMRCMHVPQRGPPRCVRDLRGRPAADGQRRQRRPAQARLVHRPVFRPGS